MQIAYPPELPVSAHREELLEAIREDAALRHIPVVAVTAYDASGNAIRQGHGFFVDLGRLVTSRAVLDRAFRAVIARTFNAVSVDTDIVSGGGTLFHDPRTGTYFGVFDWREHPIFLRPTLGPVEHVDGTVLRAGDRLAIDGTTGCVTVEDVPLACATGVGVAVRVSLDKGQVLVELELFSAAARPLLTHQSGSISRFTFASRIRIRASAWCYRPAAA